MESSHCDSRILDTSGAEDNKVKPSGPAPGVCEKADENRRPRRSDWPASHVNHRNLFGAVGRNTLGHTVTAIFGLEILHSFVDRPVNTSSLLQVSLIYTSSFDYKTASTTSAKVRAGTSQTALTECHLQVECSAPQPSHMTANDSEPLGVVRKIRIPVRAARGPQGPRGLRGPAGPRGPPGFSPEINEDIVTNGRVKRRVTSQRLPSYTPPERHFIVWRLEEQKDYEDIHILELRVGTHGFSDRLASLDDFAGTCSIEMVRPNASGAQYCDSLESMLPELISTSVGIVIDWDAIEGTTEDEIWRAFQNRLVDETIFRPVVAAYSAQFRSAEAFSAWQRNSQDNTRRRDSETNVGCKPSPLGSQFLLLLIYGWLRMKIF
ncbi:hypothetical protein EGR_05663 [Echinococcus granulosus]|uniref:Uncharacterized protein n=1 Tax=Echinococcus granulosus TaxID=6210 RepID=W6UEN2_ECHGR|nr:hypothetical protein EGR_05663 [Echinococcus granulosus]EUB59513.1 hypothetical protein EGR_05663 [Echinococcus granulosus]